MPHLWTIVTYLSCILNELRRSFFNLGKQRLIATEQQKQHNQEIMNEQKDEV